MKKALVTGALGQDGSYLSEYLLAKGYKVYGLVRKAAWTSNWYVNWASSHAKEDSIEFIYGDMRDDLSVRNAIVKSWPDEIYNLAGQVFVPLSWQEPAQTFDVNTGGLSRILHVVEQIKADTKVYQASTSEMIGNRDEAFDETTELLPTSPYGISKVAAHKLVSLYRTRGLFVVAGILCNHESPRRNQEMVTRKIACAAAAWSLGDTSTLFLGNMESRRDWGFAGDYVEAMHAMLQAKEATDYVVGTGQSHSVKDFLEESAIVAGVDQKFLDEHVKLDERFSRKQEIHNLRANTSKIRETLGWRPRVGFKELVRLMVNAEKLRLKGITVQETAVGCQ
jgi:GDPmannose 4,6-dehydratase